MKSIIQGAVLVFLVAGKSFSRGAQFWRKYVIAPFCPGVLIGSREYVSKREDFFFVPMLDYSLSGCSLQSKLLVLARNLPQLYFRNFQFILIGT